MDAGRKIKVLIVDDHAIVRLGLATLLEAYEEFELVGEASDGAQALLLCAQAEPDVVLMDLMMPGMDGIAATRALRQQCPAARIVVLTSFGDEFLVQRALQAGALGYLLKNASHEELAAAIRAAHAGKAVLGTEATQALIRAATQPPPPGQDLTPREREVLALLVQGMSNAQIAEKLVFTESTAKAHVSNILSKMGVASRTEAVALALKRGLAGRPS